MHASRPPYLFRGLCRGLALLCLALSLSCATYRSEVLSARVLPERVIYESEREEVPGTRRSSLRARLVMDGTQERLVLEEVVVADFATDRKVITRRAEVRQATVRSDMLSVNDSYHRYWAFPHSSAYIASNDDVALGVVSYLFALPLVTWTDLLADVVSIPYHTLQMALNERDRVVESEPAQRLDFERNVVLEVAPLAGEVQAVRVHRGDETTLVPERDLSGEYVLTARELLPLDAPLQNELEVSFLHAGVARRLPVEMPGAWQALRRAELGFDTEVVTGGGAPQPRVSLHLPDTLRAGDAAFLALDVANTGSGDFLDLIAELRSPDPHLHGRQLPLGRVRPGENASALVRLSLPRSAPAGLHRVGVVFRSANAAQIEPLIREIEVLPRPTPRLVASLEPVIVVPTVDPLAEAVNAMAEAATAKARAGGSERDLDRAPTDELARDRDTVRASDNVSASASLRAPHLAPLGAPARPQLIPGETLRLRAHVRNVGAGDALDTRLELNAPHPALRVPGQAFELGDLRPGQSTHVEFDVTLSEAPRAQALPLLVSLSESGLGERNWQDLSLPLDREFPALPAALQPPVSLNVLGNGLLARLAGLPADTELTAFEVLGQRWHVRLPGGRNGWVDDETVQVLPPASAATLPDTTGHEPTVREPTARDTNVHEPTVREPTVHEPTVREPPLREPTASAPVAQKPIANERAVESPTPGATSQRATEPVPRSQSSTSTPKMQPSPASRAEPELTASSILPASPRPPAPDVGEQRVFLGSPGKMPDDRPATIELEQVLPRRVDTEHVRVALTGSDDHELRELRVLLNSRDVRVERADTRGDDELATSQRAVANLALRPGLNRFEVIASDGVNADTELEHVIYRDTALADTWLLVIGIDDYADTQIPDLRSAQADALALGHALSEALRVPPRQRLALLGSEATQAALFDLLDVELARRLDPEDELIVVFAGHARAWNDADTPVAALVPYDATAHAEPSALWTAEQLATRFDALPTDKIALLLDAGFATGAARGLGPGLARELHEQALAPLLGRAGRLVLSATELDRGAAENEQQGRMSATFLNMLDGAGDVDADGELSLRELFTALTDALRDAGVQQRPQLYGAPLDDLALQHARPR
ncbi:MAG: hypothetical protein DHS20C15_13930 [Planctomycetota bacterium]|nr:MAG: hypothetical protein DHS20C15_13930 [Planctomycetota bacterium]